MKPAWQLTLLYFILIFVIIYLADKGGLNTDYLRDILPFFDKIAHFFLMGMAAFMLNLCLNCKQLQWQQFNFLLGSVIVLVFVTLEEFSQLYFPHRSFDLWDLTADFIGIYLLGRLALRWQTTKN